MKLSTAIVAAVAFAGIATAASASVTVYESYGYSIGLGDIAVVYGVNTGGAVADFTLYGTDLGPLGAGATSAYVSLGDPCEGGICGGTISASIPGAKRISHLVVPSVLC